MATTTIPDLAAKTAPVAADLVVIADSAASNATKKSTLANLAKGMQGAAVADIPTPASATAEDCANKINALLASLRAANLLAT